MKTRIAIVDDHPIVVDGLRSMFASETDYDVVSVGYTGEDAISIFGLHEIDVLLLDINLPDINGLEAAKRILIFNPQANILALTMNDSPDMIRRCMEAGMKGYVLKNTMRDELLQALQYVRDGESFMSPEVLAALEARPTLSDSPQSPIEKMLTKREKEVLSHILEEKTTQEIADILALSVLTVETHRKNILHKLGVKNTAGLVKLAVESGFGQ